MDNDSGVDEMATQPEDDIMGPTQEISTQEFDAADAGAAASEQPKPYGHLLPIAFGHVIQPIALSGKQFSVGRSKEMNPKLDFSFDRYVKCKGLKSIIKAVSKLHLCIMRDDAHNSTCIVDLSSNGTFVNEERLANGRNQLLTHGDVISIGHVKNKLFTYTAADHMEQDMGQQKYPEALRKNYVITHDKLGEGAMGRVMRAYVKSDPEQRKQVAVKIIQKGPSAFTSLRTNPTSTKAIQREIDIMKAIQHPCCVRVLDVVDTEKAAFIAMELIEGGELFDRIIEPKRNGKGLGEDLTKFYTYQMLQAIQYLHEKSISHRDIKPENVMLLAKEDYTLVKLGDFGLSKLVDEKTVMKTFCGTPTYLAPEVLMSGGTGEYTNAVDMWSLGAVIFVAIVGYPAFSKDYKDMSLNQQIMTGRLVVNETWKGISNDALNFVKGLLNVAPMKRLTATEALNHQWMLNGMELINRAKTIMQQHTTSEDDSSCLSHSPDSELQPSSNRKRQRPVEPMETEEVQTSNKKRGK